MVLYWTKKGKFKTRMDEIIPFGELHRLEGPALIWPDGSIEWHIDGRVHNSHGPATISSDGNKKWFLAGVQHRLDGPAIEYSNGDREWWIYGKYFSTELIENWLKENNIDLSTNEGQMALKLTWS